MNSQNMMSRSRTRPCWNFPPGPKPGRSGTGNVRRKSKEAERENGAAQLPNELKEPLLKRSNTQRFGVEEFYNRVHARANIGFPDAVKGTRAVMHVLQEAISAGEMKDLFSEFPSDYHNLLASPSSDTL